MEHMEGEQFNVALQKIPEGCEAIREEEFYRLPEYVLELMSQSWRGELSPASQDEVKESLEVYLRSQNSSNSQVVNIVENAESTTINHECDGERDPGSGGSTHLPEQRVCGKDKE